MLERFPSGAVRESMQKLVPLIEAVSYVAAQKKTLPCGQQDARIAQVRGELSEVEEDKWVLPA
jgi:hypothetical protein